MNEPTATDWAYLAGFIDGEGSLVLCHRKRRDRHTMSENSYQCNISIVNTDFKVIDWIQDTFGGSLYLDQRYLKPGNRYGTKPIHCLSWHSKENVGYILNGIMPYLLTKYEVAEAILHFTETPIWEKELRKHIYEGIKNTKLEVKTNGK